MNARAQVPGRGLALAAIIVIIVGGLLMLAMSRGLTLVASNITLLTRLTNISAQYGMTTALTTHNLSMTTLKGLLRELAYVVLALGLVAIIIGLIAIPTVYVPASHGNVERAASWALPLGILYIVVGFFAAYIIFGLVAGILMLLARRSFRNYAKQVALKAA